jgi:PAS domain S-box-containing protein
MQSFLTYLEKILPPRQQLRFIEQVAQSTPDIIYVLDLEERKIIFINERVSSILGFAPEEVYKQGAKFFVKKLHPDDYLQRMQHITACQDMKENEVKTIDVRLRVRDGSWRWFRIRDIAFKFDNGKVSQTIGVARDINELKLAENEIREKEAFLSTAINLIPDPLYAFKAIRNSKDEIEDFEWIMLNEAASVLIGDTIGKRLTKKYPGVVDSGLFDMYKQVVESGKSCTTEILYDNDNIKRRAKLFMAKLNDGFMVLSSSVAEKNKNAE